MAEHHLVYHWKHGWIPLTHAAALSKAKGNSKLADKYVRGTSSHHADRVTAGKSARELHGGLEKHARIMAHPGTFRGESGHHITGTDTHGRKVAVFVPGDRASAQRAIDNIHADRPAFHSESALAPAASPAPSLDARRAERAAQTPREIHDRLQVSPASVTDSELSRLISVGGRFAPSAREEQRRRDVEKMRVQGISEFDNFNPRTGRMDDASPPTAAPAPSTARIEATNSTKRATVDHSGDGTLLHIDRSDVTAREAAKAAGFKYSSNLGSWYLPRNWGESTRRAKVTQLQNVLGHDNVHLNDAGHGVTTTAAEREAAARANAADRAERMDARAQRAATEADVRFGRAHAIGDMIPMGQPILVGHHSEGRHRRDIARIDTNMRKGVEAHQESVAAASAAGRARAAAAGDSPLMRQRRIDRNEAELRSLDRRLMEHGIAVKAPVQAARVGIHPLTPEYHAQLTASRARLADEIAHDKLQIAASGHVAIQQSHLSPGDVVTYRGRAHIVKKVNKTTVSVPTGYSWDDKVPINQLSGHKKLADVSTSTLEAAAKRETDPKVRQHLIAELNRRGVHVSDL